MGSFSLIHWVIFAVLVLLLFGGKRFSNMMGDVASGLKNFKKGMSDEDEAKPQDRASDRGAGEPQRQIPPQAPHNQPPIDITPRPADPVTPSPPPSSSTTDDQTR